MMETLIKFLADSTLIDPLTNFLVFLFPILFIIFFRPGWVRLLMIFPGAACFGYGLFLSSYFDCKSGLISCGDEVLTENGLWLALFIGGLIYSIIIFIMIHIIWPYIWLRIRPRKR
jgi:hypothetical protein